jgi:hypothetical protein
MELRNRKALLLLEDVVIERHRIAFSVSRTLSSRPDSIDVSVYNLDETRRDRLTTLRDVQISLEVGYSAGSQTVFSGTLRNVEHAREGAEDVTRITGAAGIRVRRDRLQLSVARNTPIITAIETIVRRSGLGEGNLRTLKKDLGLQVATTPRSLTGSPQQQMKAVLDGVGFQYTIQNGSFVFTRKGQAATNTAVVLSGDTGLIGRPTISRKGVLSARCLLIPGVMPGRLVQVIASTDRKPVDSLWTIRTDQVRGDTHGPDWYIDFEARRAESVRVTP